MHHSGVSRPQGSVSIFGNSGQEMIGKPPLLICPNLIPVPSPHLSSSQAQKVLKEDLEIMCQSTWVLKDAWDFAMLC